MWRCALTSMADADGERRAAPSGIVTDEISRARTIPASMRADGSCVAVPRTADLRIRRERKVKPGFTPAEDVQRFRSSRVLAKQREARALEEGRRGNVDAEPQQPTQNGLSAGSDKAVAVPPKRATNAPPKRELFPLAQRASASEAETSGQEARPNGVPRRREPPSPTRARTGAAVRGGKSADASSRHTGERAEGAVQISSGTGAVRGKTASGRTYGPDTPANTDAEPPSKTGTPVPRADVPRAEPPRALPARKGRPARVGRAAQAGGESEALAEAKAEDRSHAGKHETPGADVADRAGADESSASDAVEQIEQKLDSLMLRARSDT